MKSYGEIEWEVDEILDGDIDGSGTREVALTGYADATEGGGRFLFQATGQWGYPYVNGEFDSVQIEDKEYVPFEPEPELAEAWKDWEK